jgi:lysophospholipase L1-like esterase
MKSTTLALLFVLVGCGGSIQNPPVRPQSAPVVFFGDSIFGRMDLNAYFPGKGYVNGGMFGYRTDQLKALLPDVISGNKVCSGLAGNDIFPLTCTSIAPPKTIVIMAGWNNFFQNNSGDALADLQSMTATARANGVNVIICTLYAYDPAHPAPWMVPTGNAPVTFYDMWRTPLNRGISTEKAIAVVDFSSALSAQSDYTLDGVHPNSSGYAQMAQKLSAVLN